MRSAVLAGCGYRRPVRQLIVAGLVSRAWEGSSAVAACDTGADCTLCIASELAELVLGMASKCVAGSVLDLFLVAMVGAGSAPLEESLDMTRVMRSLWTTYCTKFWPSSPCELSSGTKTSPVPITAKVAESHTEPTERPRWANETTVHSSNPDVAPEDTERGAIRHGPGPNP